MSLSANLKYPSFSASLDLGVDIKVLDSKISSKHFSHHSYSNMELIYVKSGSILLTAQSDGIYQEFSKGDLVIIPPNKPYEIYSYSETAYSTSMQFNIEALINNTFSSAAFFKHLFEGSLSLPISTNDEVIVKTAIELIDAWRSRKNAIIIQGYAYQLLGHLFDLSYESKTDEMPKKMQHILNYIKENLSEKISTKTISKTFGYTENYLCALFKAQTGTSISIYIQMLRIEKSKRILKETNTDIGKVATQCGFSDFSYFCRCFKKHIGITPLEFRKRNQQSIDFTEINK